MTRSAKTGFADLLQTAVTDPGTVHRAYRQFHNYSLGNQLLAWSQCAERGIPPGPINTYLGWQALGRQVRKGEKALTLCMPITVKRLPTADQPDVDAADGADGDVATFTRFVYKARWFVLSQTEGADMPEPEIPSWDKDQALEQLGVQEIQFDGLDGNCLGFARGRMIAISPINPLPHKTRFHELAHVLLGHTSEGMQADDVLTPRNLREAEAESVALLCCSALDLPGILESRGYIHAWWGHRRSIPETSARAILRVADQILKAGEVRR